MGISNPASRATSSVAGPAQSTTMSASRRAPLAVVTPRTRVPSRITPVTRSPETTRAPRRTAWASSLPMSGTTSTYPSLGVKTTSSTWGAMRRSGSSLRASCGRDDLDRIAPAREPLHRFLQLGPGKGLLFPGERALLLVPVAAPELAHERQVLDHARRVEIVVVARRLVEGVRPREARAGRPASRGARLEHGDPGAALGEPVGDVRADAARADHDDVRAAHMAPTRCANTGFPRPRRGRGRG